MAEDESSQNKCKHSILRAKTDNFLSKLRYLNVLNVNRINSLFKIKFLTCYIYDIFIHTQISKYFKNKRILKSD